MPWHCCGNRSPSPGQIGKVARNYPLFPARQPPHFSPVVLIRTRCPISAKDAALSSRARGISSLTLMGTLYYCLGNIAESLDR